EDTRLQGVTRCHTRVRKRKRRVQPDRLTEILQRCLVAARCVGAILIQTFEIKVIRRRVNATLAIQTRSRRRRQSCFECSRDTLCYFTLSLKDIFEFPIKVFRPDLAFRSGVYKPDFDPHRVPETLNAPLEEV